MSQIFFSIPALAPTEAQADLNAFCASHLIFSIEWQFVVVGNHRPNEFLNCKVPAALVGYRGRNANDFLDYRLEVIA